MWIQCEGTHFLPEESERDHKRQKEGRDEYSKTSKQIANALDNIIQLLCPLWREVLFSEVQNINYRKSIIWDLGGSDDQENSELVDCVGKLVWSSWTYHKDIASCLQESHVYSTIDTSVCCPWYSMWEEFT